MNIEINMSRHSGSSIIGNLENMRIYGSPKKEFGNFIFKNASSVVPKKSFHQLVYGQELFDFENHDLKMGRPLKKIKDERYLMDVYSLIYIAPKLREPIRNREVYSILSKPFYLSDHGYYLRCFVSRDGESVDAHLLKKSEVLELSRTQDWILSY